MRRFHIRTSSIVIYKNLNQCFEANCHTCHGPMKIGGYSLGTALGDFLADDSGLGFFGSWILITGILAVILAATFLTKGPSSGNNLHRWLIDPPLWF